MMNETWVGRGSLLVALLTACTPPLEADHAEHAAQRAAAVRPEGWAEDSHGEAAAPNYARLFPDDRVQRLDIVLTPEVHARLFDDLRQRFGDAATGTTPANVTACAGAALDAPCAFLGLSGVCTNLVSMGLAFVPQGRLSCRAADQNNVRDIVPGDPPFVSATVHYEGKVWSHVGLRFKGNSSLARSWGMGVRKLGMKLDFDKLEGEHPEIADQRFFGFGELTFAPGYSDPSLLHDKLASDLLRDFGIVGARASYVRVFVDVGEGPTYWGLYTMIEDPADRLLEVRFGDDSGNLYKPDGRGAEFSVFDPTFIEKKHNDPSDFSDLRRLFDALHAPRADAARWRAGLEATFDVDTFLRNMALNRAINHWDSYGTFAHNYYLYGDPARAGRLVWIGWDHNSDWTTNIVGPQIGVMMENLSAQQWPLARFLVDDPVYRARYRGFLAASLEGPYEKARFDAHVRALHALIAPYVVGPEGERAPFSYITAPQPFLNGPTSVSAAADARRAAIRTALAKESATTPAR
jgi:hypothetical protein